VNSRRVFNGLIAATLFATLLEVITGFILLPFYSVKDPYKSSVALEASPVLHFLQTFHHWLSAALIVLLGIFVLFGLWSAAYRMSSKKLWGGSIILLVLILLLQLTGHLLPWDQHAVRTAAIETSIAQKAPVVGAMQADLLRGGKAVGPETLSIWFWAHVAILPLFWLLLTVLLAKKIRPGGFSKKALVAGGAAYFVFSLGCAIGMAVQLGPGASTVDYGAFDAKPEWYVLPLHSLLDIFQNIGPNFAFVGTMVIPAVVLLLVILAPWMDLKREAGKPSIYGMVLSLVIFLGSCILIQKSASNVAVPNGPNLFAKAAAGGSTVVTIDPKLAELGQKLFTEQGCDSCHTVDGSGGNGGPDLKGEVAKHPDRNWQVQHLTKPTAVVPGSTMPSFANVGDSKLKALAEYVLSLK
jgi:quinol-cytochrome oxidoreductase complex cytochrome b subunit/cytochrome c551/c552